MEILVVLRVTGWLWQEAAASGSQAMAKLEQCIVNLDLGTDLDQQVGAAALLGLVGVATLPQHCIERSHEVALVAHSPRDACHTDAERQDLERVAEICAENSMFLAHTHICVAGLGDFVAPMAAMFLRLKWELGHAGCNTDIVVFVSYFVMGGTTSLGIGTPCRHAMCWQ